MLDNKQDFPISIRISSDLLIGIRQSGQTNSDFIREAIQEKLEKENLDIINEEIEGRQREIKNLEKRKKLLVQKQKETKDISMEEIAFLLEAKEKISKNPLFLDGQHSRYCNLFPKPYKISKQDFIKLLDEAENQNQEKQII